MQPAKGATAPEVLAGDDGEVVFVRADLALSATHARGVALVEGYNLSGRDVDVVEMLPVPEHFTEIDYEWAVVKPGTPGATSFYRFTV